MKDRYTAPCIKDDEEDPDVAPTGDLGAAAEGATRRLLTVLAVAAVLLWSLHATPFGLQLQTRAWDALAELSRAGGPRSIPYFLCVSSLLIFLGAPRLFFCGLAGFAFGFWEGMLWSLASSLLGSLLAFHAARWGGRRWLARRFGTRRFFGSIIRARPTIASVALIRMLPVSNGIINVGLAMGQVRNKAFLIGSLLGFLPHGAVAVVVGSGMAAGTPFAAALQIGTTGALLLGAAGWIYRRRQQPQAGGASAPLGRL